MERHSETDTQPANRGVIYRLIQTLTMPVGILLSHGLADQGGSITRPTKLLRFVRYSHCAEQLVSINVLQLNSK